MWKRKERFYKIFEAPEEAAWNVMIAQQVKSTLATTYTLLMPAMVSADDLQCR